MKIKKIIAREILDSRGNPTLEVCVELKNGIKESASVPSGASTGVHEALELRDNDSKRYLGRGVLKAVKNINEIIAPKLLNIDVRRQVKIDRIMINLDGTENKKHLGANAILGVSLACARVAAKSLNQPLYKYIRQVFGLHEKGWIMPLPMMNIVNGGKHADNSLTIQEFMIVPSAGDFHKRVRIGAEVFHNLKILLKQKGFQTLVGDEGGYAPNLKKNEEALDFIMKAIKKAGYRAGRDVFIAIDLALSEYYDKKIKKYYFDDKKRKQGISASALIKTLDKWIKKYPIISLEDPLAEDDWENWQIITGFLGAQVKLVGDDLFVTNCNRLAYGIENQIANSILIKLNQIGTLTETIDAIYLAKEHDYKIIISHRSGETADTFIADLAVAVNAEFIKAGSLSRYERVAKYNRLMQIEDELK
jgi:enolase